MSAQHSCFLTTQALRSPAKMSCDPSHDQQIRAARAPGNADDRYAARKRSRLDGRPSCSGRCADGQIASPKRLAPVITALPLGAARRIRRIPTAPTKHALAPTHGVPTPAVARRAGALAGCANANELAAIAPSAKRRQQADAKRSWLRLGVSTPSDHVAPCKPMTASPCFARTDAGLANAKPRRRTTEVLELQVERLGNRGIAICRLPVGAHCAMPPRQPNAQGADKQPAATRRPFPACSLIALDSAKDSAGKAQSP